MSISPLAESIFANGQADLVVLGRTPRVAKKLKDAHVKLPVPYERSKIF